jgi:hypothetical protein
VRILYSSHELIGNIRVVIQIASQALNAGSDSKFSILDSDQADIGLRGGLSFFCVCRNLFVMSTRSVGLWGFWGKR